MVECSKRERVIARSAKRDVAIPTVLRADSADLMGIPTPVCALARNDIIVFNLWLPAGFPAGFSCFRGVDNRKNVC